MSDKICINLQDISLAGYAWDMQVSPDLLMNVDIGSVNALVDVCHAACWRGSLEKSYGVYTLRGTWSVAILRQCDRCISTFEWAVSGDVLREYALERFGDIGDDAQEDIEILAVPGALNLVDVLREEVWLAWKSCVVCKDSCKGLCQGCGVNLNHDACECSVDGSDNPFAVLGKMKFDA